MKTTKNADGASLKRMVGPDRRYAKAHTTITAIQSQFCNGASVKRLSRKHSLPVRVVESLIRMRFLAQGKHK